MNVPEIVRRSYEFFNADGHPKVALPIAGTTLILVIAAWRYIRRRPVQDKLRWLTFQPGGLREPVHKIARKHGTTDDLHRIDGLLNGTNSEFDKTLYEFERRRDWLRNQVGDIGLAKLDDLIAYAKRDIREDLAELSKRRDPTSGAAQESAKKIEAKMTQFNEAIAKILHDHYPRFWTEVANLRKKIQGR